MAPRQSHTKSQPPLGSRTLILDPGTFTIKAGFVSHTPPTATAASPEDPLPQCHIIQNAIAKGTDPFHARKERIYIADQLDQCHDFSEMAFRRPVEKGYIVSWDGEMDIWKQILFRDGAKLHCDPHDTNLILTESPNCPQALQSNADQMIFEEFQFASAYRCIGATLNAWNPFPPSLSPTPITTTNNTSSPPQEATLIIDASHTSTTITPILHTRPLHHSIRRLDISGRLLTNRLKESISLQHFNLMDDSWLLNQVKEDVCFVSLDFARDLERSWHANLKSGSPRYDASATLEYVLPDYSGPSHVRGYARAFDPVRARQMQRGKLGPAAQGQQAQETSFPISTLRFSVPELLFQPRSLGLAQPGLPECIVQSISSIPFPALHPAFLGNVVCVGGTSKLPGFVERVQRELRALVPEEMAVNVRRAEDPVTATWEGGVRMVRSLTEGGEVAVKGKKGGKEKGGVNGLRGKVVTKAEYEEMGGAWTARVFGQGGKR